MSQSTVQHTSIKQLRLQYTLDKKRFGQPTVAVNEYGTACHSFGEQLYYLIGEQRIERRWQKDMRTATTIAEVK